MRRKEREITDPAAMEAILRRATVCRVAFGGKDGPYVVPMSFGYDARRLYLHCAPEGKKLERLREDPRVAFEVDLDHELVRGPTACDWTLRYRSVVGSGVASLVTSPEEKRRGLDVLMRQHGGALGPVPDGAVSRACVLRIEVREMTGKQSGY